MKHYTVISPDITTYYWDEPPEYECDVVDIHAENKRDAKIMALKTDEFKQWIKYIRGDNPFTGLKVIEHICPHGLCQCAYCSSEDGPTYPPCLEEYNRISNLTDKEYQEYIKEVNK